LSVHHARDILSEEAKKSGATAMATGDKLPAASSERGIALSEQSGSLVARGLDAIKNSQQGLARSGVEPDPINSFLEGVTSETRGDYAEAVKWYKKAADQGCAEAHLNLAFMYVEGRAPDEGGGQDCGAWYFFETEDWLRLAAERGYVKAQSKLGVLLYDHVDLCPQKRTQYTAKQFNKARKWLRLAAKQGEAEAQYYLGHMYYTGRLVPQDYGEAIKWCRLAAEQGNADAAYDLGLMYFHGQAVPQNYMRAYMWLGLAARSASYTEDREKAVTSRDRAAANLQSGQIAEAQRLLREARRDHAS
jgi:hypothetical protein